MTEELSNKRASRLAHFGAFSALQCSRTSMYAALRCSKESPNCTQARDSKSYETEEGIK